MRSAHVASQEVVSGGPDRAADDVVAGVERSQLARQARQLGRRAGSSPSRRPSRGFVERHSDRGLGARGGERKVPGPLFGIGHGSPEDPVDVANLLRGRLGENGRPEQRMGEADPPVPGLDHARSLGRPQSFNRPRAQGVGHDRDAGSGRRRHHQQRSPGRIGERRELGREQGPPSLRDRKPLTGFQRHRALDEVPADLEREERVPTGALEHPPKGRQRELLVQPRSEETAGGIDLQRPHRELAQVGVRERPLEIQRLVVGRA
jgi:hypothetical protein